MRQRLTGLDKHDYKPAAMQNPTGCFIDKDVNNLWGNYHAEKSGC